MNANGLPEWDDRHQLPRHGWVYLVRLLNEPGVYKVGYGHIILGRLVTLNRKMPISPEWLIYSNHCQKLEAYIHHQWAAWRVKNELFRPPESAIENLKRFRLVNWKNAKPAVLPEGDPLVRRWARVVFRFAFGQPIGRAERIPRSGRSLWGC